jgi:hypothetical protein
MESVVLWTVRSDFGMEALSSVEWLKRRWNSAITINVEETNAKTRSISMTTIGLSFQLDLQQKKQTY